MTHESRLTDHIDRFNACVRTGHFKPYAALFAADGTMRLLGAGQPTSTRSYEGRDDIASACARLLADDTLRIVSVIASTEDHATFDYARGSSPKEVAGQIILRWRDGHVAVMTVTMQ